MLSSLINVTEHICSDRRGLNSIAPIAECQMVEFVPWVDGVFFMYKEWVYFQVEIFDKSSTNSNSL